MPNQTRVLLFLLRVFVKPTVLLVLLYLFLLSIGMMGSSFKLLGADSSHGLLQVATANPFVGLLIGILATSLVQSSSTVSSTVVAIVASGALDVSAAVPIIMGANIGTTVTNTLVSLGHITQNREFSRAFAAATVHDFFNVFAVIIILPLEIATHFIERSATYITSLIREAGGFEFTSPVVAITKPVITGMRGVFEGISNSVSITAWLLLFLSFGLLFFCLYFLTRTLKSLMLSRLEIFFDRLIGRNVLIAIGLGTAITVLVQSSSITTSLIVPMAGAGIVTLRQIFPVTLGANIGTTVTALLATLGATGRPEAALTIALCHLLFNLYGILFIYPIPAIRRVPLFAAEKIAATAVRSKQIVLFYLLGLFFALPGLCVFLTVKLF